MMPWLVPRSLADQLDLIMPLVVTTTVVDVVAVAVAEDAVVSMTEDVVAEVVDVAASMIVAVEARAVVVGAAPTVGALETSRARSRLSRKSAMAMPVGVPAAQGLSFSRP
jgi:hypothetical protein